MITRRQFVASALTAAVATPLAAALYAWRIEPHWLEITHHLLPVRDLPPDLDGRILAQLSDLHIGPKVDDAYILETFRRTSALNPDLVVFTGDFITYRSPAQFDQLQRLLSELPHGTLGTVGVLGNHDYGFGWSMRDVADRVAGLARSAGIDLLRNDVTTIAGLQFAGLDDLWSHQFDLRRTLDSLSPALPTLALCHNPDGVDDPKWYGYSGWILGGHTHGGQCKPPFLPPPLLPVRNRRYTAGEFALSGDRRLYISRGVGHLLGVRFNVRPEVAIFRLVRA